MFEYKYIFKYKCMHVHARGYAIYCVRETIYIGLLYTLNDEQKILRAMSDCISSKTKQNNNLIGVLIVFHRLDFNKLN